MKNDFRIAVSKTFASGSRKNCLGIIVRPLVPVELIFF